jgi:hypothetical protein
MFELHRGAPARRPAALILLLGVAVVHGWLAAWLAETARLGEGTAEREARLRRIEVAFVRELAPQAPPAPAAAPPRRPAPAARSKRAATPLDAAQAATAAASAVAAAASAPLAVPAAPTNALPELQAVAPAAAASMPEAPAAAGSAAAGQPVAVASTPSPPAPAAPFEWPPSTRLSYTLTGDYRGPVHGRAQVEWIRAGGRYQVHLDVSIGPLLGRRMSSEGAITPAGLAPRRYEEETRMLLREARRAQIDFQPDRTVLAGGREGPAPAGLQDTASQFVQLAWLFNLDPRRAEAGQTIELPLALPRRVETWVYDVIGEERLATPVGEIGAVYLKPRRLARAGGDLVAESWFAPTLQYLPVRIRIRQDAETYIDLLLERLPQQAAPDAPTR